MNKWISTQKIDNHTIFNTEDKEGNFKSDLNTLKEQNSEGWCTGSDQYGSLTYLKIKIASKHNIQ